ncbi:MAG: indolepyruvate ferredoxin oxidoreductase family protein [Alphaproteobacteria bacterium]|nr:indolepyruvate ferredoxin oxidoreductase family protein [Alphaproteobacteria bacterium]MBU1516396.1 indolepyruvate ferredoxin oxidoreductase family protein [Alphaproteobacteria bacterium]MBU2093367.1 indolepyruvate ferredoxin oxidoreductase family protein [Alphaproteobacteria bacterium]MBU2153854.1 indolepyruvate ferredoxin oxidoreductase family protein [Alphaproteobacteria bacterium]MBU2307726.1 indolepyruvate ferredoxin oxidoreductase family protein [Alphaproteobacteria bacterium]
MKLAEASLSDAFRNERGQVYMTGMQALVRLMLEQHALDRAAGLRTAGYVTGYRGSPLGGFDAELTRQSRLLTEADVRFHPGLNEDLAATAVLGTQQAEAFGGARYDGVYSLWYGKGPGVDRSGDAFRHGARYGAARRGGVLLAFGDDHPGKSSTVAHQSDAALAANGIAVLAPSNLEDVISFGLYGWAASRATASWVGLKCVNETAEATASVDLDAIRRTFLTPVIEEPPGGLHGRLVFDVAGDELRHIRYRLPAMERFAEANRIDRVVGTAASAPLGIVTSGKSFLDVMEALRLLGMSVAQPGAPVAILKIGQAFPIDSRAMQAFAAGRRELLFVEEKAGLLETQAAQALFNMPPAQRPRIVGKKDDAGALLVPSHGVLDAHEVAVLIGDRLTALGIGDADLRARVSQLKSEKRRAAGIVAARGARTPWFCAGCPHSTSTRTPEGSTAFTGIGCHTMAIWMDRDSLPPTQMGGEGANWIGMAPYVATEHVFQNLGDGTFNHSGLLAIRAAVAAGVSITYKILFNDAVAMTGGQPHDGGLTVGDVARQVQAERVVRTVVVAEDPDRISGLPLPRDVAVHGRGALDTVQKSLRDTPGVTVLIYDQTCAAELRRRRKRGLAETPSRRVIINERVCEGCGDCSVKSNCVAVLPKPTALGLKRQVDQSACNRDFSCLEGFCPSFVEIDGASIKVSTPERFDTARLTDLPEPTTPARPGLSNIMVAGVGGTGVVTVGALIAMAAHLQGLRFAAYDMTGLAQKGGAVFSHLRVGPPGTADFGPRIPQASADVLIGCDSQVAASSDAIAATGKGRTAILLNDEVAPPGAFQIGGEPGLDVQPYRNALAAIVGVDAVRTLEAGVIARRFLGDAIYANLVMLGAAYQFGHLPVSGQALERAIELNGAKVEQNLLAFRLGRLAAHDPSALVTEVRKLTEPQSLQALVGHRADHLTAYQNTAYAQRFTALVEQARAAAQRAGLDESFPAAVADTYANLMAYKDEYEVARLYADGAFAQQVSGQFVGGKLSVWLSPPLFAPRDPATGRPRKIRFGPWIFTAFRLLARLKGLRGSPLDPFGWLPERRDERRAIVAYERLVERLCADLTPAQADAAIELARLPRSIRGFGHVKAAAAATAAARQIELLAAFEDAKASGDRIRAPA